MIDVLERVIGTARRLGADEAVARVTAQESLTASARGGRVENVHRAERQNLTLCVFVGQRQAQVRADINVFLEEEEMVVRALALARAAPKNPWGGLPPVSSKGHAEIPLDLVCARRYGTKKLVKAACELEAAALECGVSACASAQAFEQKEHTAILDSAGFMGTYERTLCGFFCEAVAKEKDHMVRDYAFEQACHWEDVPSASRVGREAAHRALQRRSPRKIVSTRAPVIYDQRIAGTVIQHLGDALSGSAVARKSSFLKDALGTRVFAPNIQIYDDPHRPRGHRSVPFDHEGVKGSKCPVVSEGVIKMFFLDTPSARQLKKTSTGHAFLGNPAPSNCYMEPGSDSLEELMSRAQKGFFVTELIGAGVNTVSGDYSRGAAGLWFEDGAFAFPVSEVTLAGSLTDIFRHMTPAKNLVFRTGIDAPSFLVESMAISGQ